MRLLTTKTRRKLEDIISRISKGEKVTLNERIDLNKYSNHIPFIAGKLSRALNNGQQLCNDDIK